MADNNFRSFAGERDQHYTELTLSPENPTQYNDICKLSDTDGNFYEDFEFVGGSEDCIDINNGSKDNTFHGGTLHPNGKFGITIKGNSDHNWFKDIKFLSHGTEVDIDIGNDSEQSMNWTQETVLHNVHSSDGKPVTVRVGWGSKPTIIGGNVKYLFWQSLGLKAYVLFKWIQRKL